jgi:two-component system, NtrC family, sensor kinase
MSRNGRARVFPDLLTPLASAPSVEAGLDRTLRRLVALTGAQSGALAFRPPAATPLLVTAAARGRTAATDRALRALLAAPARGRAGSGDGRARRPAVLRVPLGLPRRPVGELLLVSRGRAPVTVPAGFARELGAAIEQVWRLHQRTRRITVLNDITRLLVSGDSLDDVLRTFADGLAKLLAFDSVAVALVDAERGAFDVVDIPAAGADTARGDTRTPLAGTLLADVVTARAPVRIDDAADARVPAASRAALLARGHRSALLAPLVSGGGVFGAVSLAAQRAGAFTDADVDVVTELARPLASAIEHRRLLDESRRRADELGALYATSQLITSRLDVASVLERISVSVSDLIGSTGCGIGLLDGDGTRLVNAAAHGIWSEEWRALSIPVGEGIMGRCAESGVAIRVDDVRSDPRSARRDIDESEGVRSMLCVPLCVAGSLLGVISAFSTRPAAFRAHHQRVLEAFAEQAGIAIQNAQLFEESVRRARETRALFEAGRAVTESLDLGRTVRVIMEQARAVLDIESCGVMTFDPSTGELVLVASLDLSPEMKSRVRIRPGEGITGQAVSELRPMQSEDLFIDPRVRFPELPRASGLRSMLTAPMRVGHRAIGAIVVFRRDVHRFSPAEEELLVALADQAAIALEHARLYEHLEGMVAERTRELDGQKRFVEVVLDTLPLGVFVLDRDLRVVRASRQGARALGFEGEARGPLSQRLPPERAKPVERLVHRAFEAGEVGVLEEEMTIGGDAGVFRFTAAPLGAGDAPAAHAVLLVEDITRAKQLERQMLLTERLTTAGRLAAGVAHELNNPLATIAGCAESLQSRLDEQPPDRPDLVDFRSYLKLIEEEAFRCKEITGSLLQFVREPGSRREETDLNALALKAVELLTRQSRFAGCRIETALDPALPRVAVNEGQLRQVFLGIASNALEAMDGQGRLTIRTARQRDEVVVEFEDEGPGIPADVAAHVFEPFFTTKPPGQGTGLGLAIAQRIVADHGGRIDVRPTRPRGATFCVVMPA